MKKRHLFAKLMIMLLLAFQIQAAEVDPDLQAAFAQNPIQTVVVTFNGSGPITFAQKLALTQAGITQGFTFKSLPIAGIVATQAQVNLLSQNPNVKSIYLNKQLEYHNYDGTALTGVDRLRTDQNLRIGGFPVSGKGVTVMVNDSGIDGTHEDLKYPNKVVQNVMGTTNPYAYSGLLPIVYLEDIPNTDNNSGHGTHVAGSVGGKGVRSAGKYEGVAPGCDIVGYGSGAVLLILDAIGGFDYAITNQFEYNIRIITNSWGSQGTFSPNDPVSIASKAAYDRNIVVLFSASNSGPGENTHNRYAVAPWVISVAAGDKYGRLADFSSRGVKDQTGTFTINGETWTWENRPTITGPGVDVVSTRSLVSPLPALGEDEDIEPAFLPFYTKMSGTSMSTPHVAGIVALLLQANSSLTPAQVKNILQKTATNMPSREPWEVGAGYVNAYAAVDHVMRGTEFGSTVNMFRTFNANANVDVVRDYFSIDFYPVAALSPTNNEYPFTVAPNTSAIEALVNVHGILGEEGNPVNLILISPDGTTYSSGIYVAFTLYHDRTVAVSNPMPGDWKVKLDGLHGDAANPQGTAVPELVNGYIKFITANGYSGLNDIAGHPAEGAIQLGITQRLLDGRSGGNYYPDECLTRYELADYFMMGQAVRQFLPTNGANNYGDITSGQRLVVESAMNRGAALKDRFHLFNSTVEPKGPGTFNPNDNVLRYSLAYSLVQALGLQEQALALNGQNITVNYSGQEISLDDQNEIPAGFEGYVHLALDLNLIHVFWSLEQGPFEPFPTLHAKFKPLNHVTRGEFAVVITKTHSQWGQDPLTKDGNGIASVPSDYNVEQNYPNPFNPSTKINFAIPADGMVTLEVFNVLGQKVATLINEVKPAGYHQVDFNANGLASGTYIYKITAGSYEKTMKMALLK